MNEQECERRKKLEKLRNLNQDPFSIEKITVDTCIGDLIKKAEFLDEEQLKSVSGSLIGRVFSIRQNFLTIK